MFILKVSAARSLFLFFRILLDGGGRRLNEPKAAKEQISRQTTSGNKSTNHQNEFTDKNRKKQEADKHTLGGF